MDIEKWVDKTFKLRPGKGTNVRHVEFDWNKIDESIYLGTNACCQYHFDKELLSQGVDADISLEYERIDAPRGVETFLWLPTKNHMAPSLQNLELGVAAIDKMIRQKRKIFIHCKNGHGRAPTLAAAYYISKGASTEKAIEMVKSGRKETHFEPTQLDILKQFEKLAITRYSNAGTK